MSLDGVPVNTAISILVPARNEELTLPITLPTVLKAASMLRQPVEVLVIAPPDSPVHWKPPIQDPMLRWVITAEPGKFRALKAGAAVASGGILILVDADAIVEPETFVWLIRPFTESPVDIVAGRIGVLLQARTATQRILERWAAISVSAWDLLRRGHPEFLWALPGAIYAIRRHLLPESLLVPLVDDASIGLYAMDQGAIITYAPDALILTPTGPTYRHWMSQKLRSRRGWAALASHRGAEVMELQRTLRRYVAAVGRRDPTAWLMQTQDRLLRLAAGTSLAFSGAGSDEWRSNRTVGQWR